MHSCYDFIRYHKCKCKERNLLHVMHTFILKENELYGIEYDKEQADYCLLYTNPYLDRKSYQLLTLLRSLAFHQLTENHRMQIWYIP